MAAQNRIEPIRTESAFPIERGRIGMLVFLSTEWMMFAAILGSYIVLRFAAERWPDRSTVGLELWIGVLNTLVLLLSGWTVHRSLASARQDQPTPAKMWLVATILLGCLFLAFKSSEYWRLYRTGLLPVSGQSLVYEQADDRYVARAVAEMRAAIEAAESQRADRSDREAAKRLEELYRVQSGIVDWTQLQMGQTPDRKKRQQAAAALASQIDARGEPPQPARDLQDELEQEELEAAKLRFGLNKLQNELESTQPQLAELIEYRDSGPRDKRDQYQRLSEEVTRLTDNISELRKQLQPIEQRISAIELLGKKSGINGQYALRLPIVLPGGSQWASMYLLLTGFHLLHLIAGLLVMAWMLPMKLSRARSLFVGNVALFWHFLGVVWLVIFSIVYLNLRWM